MKEEDAENKYLSKIIELHELFDSVDELIYINVNKIDSQFRKKEARKKFCKALIKLGLVK